MVGQPGMRQIVLDTETTGIEPAQGHRIIEIGAVELVDRRMTGNVFHRYLNPERPVEEGALQVHGLTNEFLAEKATFAEVVPSFLEYVAGAELIIHNAPFDVGFVNHELSLLGAGWGSLEERCTVTDSLDLARQLHPGQRCSLDALCRRYDVDASRRELHGALLDAELLAEVYLAMTGGQEALLLEGDDEAEMATALRRLSPDRPRLRVPAVEPEARAAHERMLQRVEAASGGERPPWPTGPGTAEG